MHYSVPVCLLHTKQYVERYSVFIAFSYFDNSFYYFPEIFIYLKGEGRLVKVLTDIDRHIFKIAIRREKICLAFFREFEENYKTHEFRIFLSIMQCLKVYIKKPKYFKLKKQYELYLYLNIVLIGYISQLLQSINSSSN